MSDLGPVLIAMALAVGGFYMWTKSHAQAAVATGTGAPSTSGNITITQSIVYKGVTYTGLTVDTVNNVVAFAGTTAWIQFSDPDLVQAMGTLPGVMSSAGLTISFTKSAALNVEQWNFETYKGTQYQVFTVDPTGTSVTFSYPGSVTAPITDPACVATMCTRADVIQNMGIVLAFPGTPVPTS